MKTWPNKSHLTPNGALVCISHFSFGVAELTYIGSLGHITRYVLESSHSQ